MYVDILNLSLYLYLFVDLASLNISACIPHFLCVSGSPFVCESLYLCLYVYYSPCRNFSNCYLIRGVLQ